MERQRIEFADAVGNILKCLQAVSCIYNRESAEVQQKFDDLFETIHNSNENDHPLSRLRGLLPRHPNQGQIGTEIGIMLEQLSQLRECMLS